jgi:hypothetical protein
MGNFDATLEQARRAAVVEHRNDRSSRGSLGRRTAATRHRSRPP